MMLFFFFKQKTAYEMRISDWSSDVCSSDLGDGNQAAEALQQDPLRLRRGGVGLQPRRQFGQPLVLGPVYRHQPRPPDAGGAQPMAGQCRPALAVAGGRADSLQLHGRWRPEGLRLVLGRRRLLRRVRSEELRVGKGCVSAGESRWSA